MPDYTDLSIRYIDGEATATIVFNGGMRTLDFAVTPMVVDPPPPPVNSVTSQAQLLEAVRTSGQYAIKAGSYIGNYTVSASDVHLSAEEGVTFGPSDVSKPVYQVNGSGFGLTGGLVNGGVNDAIIVGSLAATSVEQQPNGVTFDGVDVVAPTAGAKRGFALHGMNITVTRSRVEGFYRLGQEVQGVWICNGPGPYTVTDSYIEGAGENLLVGGAWFNIPGVVPSDITITGNTFFKRPEWKTNTQVAVKNILELKNAQRVLIERNVLDGCYKRAQDGSPVLFTVRNTAATEGGNNPWVIVNDVVFRHNIIRNAPDGYGINILGRDDGGRASEQTKSITIEDNLFQHCTGGVLVSSGVTDNLTIRRNTFPATTGALVLFANKTTKTALTMTENAGKTGAYGVNVSGGTPGKATLDAVCSTYTFTGNVLEKSASMTLPTGNTYLAKGALTLDTNYQLLPDPSVAGWTGTV